MRRRTTTDERPTATDEASAPVEPRLRIFLNYRREDSMAYAGRLYDDLAERLSACDVFIDIDKIEPGADFVDVIDHALDGCDVVLALIGKHWLSATDSKGRRRLDDPDDYVRLELEAALARGMRLIPVRVGGADMPSSADLPDTLRALARRQAVEISDHRWRYDVETLSGRLEQLSIEAEEREREERERIAREEAERQSAAAALAAGELAERERLEREEAARARARQEAEAREREERERLEREEKRRAELERREREQQAREEERRRRAAEKERARADAAARGDSGRRRRRAIALVGGGVALLAVLGLAVVAIREASGGPTRPSATTVPAIAGQPRAGATLRVGAGAWEGTPTAYTYRWQRCGRAGGSCRDVPGATTRRYRLGAPDVGRRIRASVTAANEAGETTVLTALTGVVAAARRPPASVSRPRVTGTAQVGSTLRLAPGAWRGTRPIRTTFAWLRCAADGADCRPIRGATGRTYSPDEQDVGRRIRVEARASNVAGRAVSRSAATAAVRPRPVAPEEPTQPPPTETETEPPDTTPLPCPPNCPEFP
jgi:hypothetical protein